MDFGTAHYADPAKAEVATFVVSGFQELSNVDLVGIMPGNEIVRDLKLDELDSLATVGIINEIEARFGITITDREAAATRTIDELVVLISSKRRTTPVVG